MKLFRKLLMLSHRYLGIAISLLVVVWFGSGIAMIYVGGMPSISREMRLERLAPLDPSRVRLSLVEAAEKAGFDASAGWSGERISLSMVMDRPAYRFGNEATVFADDGEVLAPLTLPQAQEMARQFGDVAADKLSYAGTLSEPDQWTLAQGRQLPLHKFAAADGLGTEIYVRPESGDVTMLTTRESRFNAWLGPIPHWLYFAPLRLNQPLWYKIVVWTAAFASLLAVLGLVLGFVKLGRPKPFRWSAAIPYSGWMRWHYVTGMIFGLFTLTFAFSGMLSMEPYGWTNARGLDLSRDVFTGGAVDFTGFPKPEAAAWQRALDGQTMKEIVFARLLGENYYVVRTDPNPRLLAAARERLHQPYNVTGRAEPNRLLIAAASMEVRAEPFSTGQLLARLKSAVPDSPIVEQQMLDEYDSYYYSRRQLTPLPVLRVKFADPMRTWVYIDPTMGQVLAQIHRLHRIERWFYNGLHSLDFSFWYNSRPLWDIGMIVLLLGGLASSVLGLFLGIGRMRRGAGRNWPSLRRQVQDTASAGSPAARG